MRAWALRTRERYGTVIVTSLRARARWELYLAVALTSPKTLAAHLHMRFRRWTVLPGDRMTSMPLLVESEVISVKAGHLILHVASRQLLDRGLAPDWPYGLPPGVLPTFETIERSDWRWIPA